MRYIKWTSTTEENFEHIGKFIKETDLHMHLDTKFGEMCILKTNGIFSDSTEEEFELVKIDDEPIEESQPEVIKKETDKKGPSKAERARSIYLKLHKEGKARKDIIKAFMLHADLTKAGAATYYQNFTKQFK